MWMSLRMAAQLMAMACLPFALRRWLKAWRLGFHVKAERIGLYNALRTKGSPDLEMWVFPVHLPDWRITGANPTWATACLALVRV